MFPIVGRAQDEQQLSLPRQEQLSCGRVLQVIQDSEGFLWYATEGGGVCRDDGRQILVFRSDAEHPDLLCSNDVASLAEAGGRYIIIGTFHGANVLDKSDYSIRVLDEVDDKRVDDIIVTHDGHWWLTANKKVYEYSPDGQLLNVYPGGDKYIFRLHEDQRGSVWCVEWEGGILWLEDGRLVQVTTEWPDSINFNREMTDLQGRRLMTDVFGNCYALSSHEQKPWFSGSILTRPVADSVRVARGLSARPTAMAAPPQSTKAGTGENDELWFSTGKDIRVMKQGKEEVVLSDTKDVSAMTFTSDGTLWLATIFGTLMTYKDGELVTDEYGSNEYGDVVTHIDVDNKGRLLLVSERYIRLYDTVHQTLRQQNIEEEGVYQIELQETQPGKRWSQPSEEVVERMPGWVWWMLAALVLILSALVGYIWQLKRQRERFLAAIKKEVIPQEPLADNQPAEEQQPVMTDEWLQKAIDVVEQHISDDSYSVEQLASDMCMSRMTFYRKIQSATGQKPTEFIRTIRLRRAAELLHEGRLTITEITYDTGFSSVSYFSRCFRAMYGVSPTQWVKS